jgi:hypothetical protein
VLARRALASCLVAVSLLAGACGDEDETAPSEQADKPAAPPPGWRTLREADAGFTVSIPRSWTVRGQDGSTLIRSRDKLVVITLAADRTRTGRDAAPGQYVRRTLAALPEFEGSFAPAAARVPGSPYRSARIDGQGEVESSPRSQRITVAAFQRPGLVTYVAVVFRNPVVDPRFDEPRVTRVLRSLRAQPPRGD